MPTPNGNAAAKDKPKGTSGSKDTFCHAKPGAAGAGLRQGASFAQFTGGSERPLFQGFGRFDVL